MSERLAKALSFRRWLPTRRHRLVLLDALNSTWLIASRMLWPQPLTLKWLATAPHWDSDLTQASCIDAYCSPGWSLLFRYRRWWTHRPLWWMSMTPTFGTWCAWYQRHAYGQSLRHLSIRLRQGALSTWHLAKTKRSWATVPLMYL